MSKERQHYIPVMYLKEFTDYSSRNQVLTTPYLHVFEKNSTNPFIPYKKSPKRIAYKINYYSLNDSEEKSRVFIEDVLSELEDKTTRILKRIINQPYSIYLTTTERFLLSQFIAVMDIRVPSHKENIKGFIEDIHKRIIDIIAVDRERLKGQLIQAGEAKGEKLFETEEDIDRMLEFLRSDRYEIVARNEYVNSLAFGSSGEVVTEALMNMSWEFYIAPGNLYFVTSDNPVVLFDKKHNSNFWSIGYKSSPSVEVTFPISPKICLHTTWLRKRRKDEYPSRFISSDFVKEINLRTCNYCSEYVFSCIDKLQIDFHKLGQRI